MMTWTYTARKIILGTKIIDIGLNILVISVTIVFLTSIDVVYHLITCYNILLFVFINITFTVIVCVL